ncbi:GNAT family N-acetyltransferase [Desertibaculum subflavum]|uniref:GNAT family N-acetyltransferase n=1 Tax=Desertibaculum subflavum TaxID=2268458 RepID=UPI000E67013A
MAGFPIDDFSLDKAIELNNRHAAELSHQTPDQFRRLIGLACYARWSVGRSGFLIALDERAPYANPNFAWFKQRYPAFVYIDRVVVEAPHRGRGVARALYEDLFAETRRSGRSRIVCEVNAEPPNPASDAFHARLGFSVVGTAHLVDRQKTVRYFCKALD